MMQLPIAGSLRREFAGRSEAAIYRRFQRRQEEERQRREEREEARSDTAELLDMAALVITEMEINEFRVEIDRYDAATIEALQSNERALELILRKKNELLARAYVLPDGRRVFKSEDGIRVFDEYGAELDASVIDPDLIDESHPAWEIYEPILEENNRLVEERRELLNYQAKLDDARERLDNGDLTREEFDRLRDELEAELPDTVRTQIPELLDDHQAAIDQPNQPAAAPIDLDLSEDLVPNTAGPKTFVPG